MIIGYSGEGSNDAFVIEALQEMWCPEARVEVAQWRGATGSRRKHEIRKACIELFEKNASLIIFFTDSNNRDYKIVKRNESEWIPDNYRAMTIYAVADRNIECWIVADKEKAKKEMGINKKQLEGDPVKFVNKHFGSYRDSDKKRKIKEFVKSSDMRPENSTTRKVRKAVKYSLTGVAWNEEEKVHRRADSANTERSA